MKRLLILLLAAALLTACGSKKASVDKSASLPQQLESVFTLSRIRGTDVKIVPSTDSYYVQFTHDFTFWDETDFVCRALGAYVAYCEIAYAETDVKGISFFIYGNVTDERGNENKVNLFSVSMPKSTFLTYQWDNLEMRDGYYDQIASDCTTFDIYYAVRLRMNPSEVHIIKP